MRVGLSVVTRSGQSIWENGIGQNVFFLAELLASIPFVERVILLDCGNQGAAPKDAQAAAPQFPIVPLAEAENLIDVAIELAGGLPLEWIRRFRARGGKIVFHNCGQPYAGLVEPTIFDRPMYSADPQRCDEIWILAKDEINAPFLRSLHRAPVHVLPYLWAPHFLAASAAEIEGAMGTAFGYRPGTLKKGPAQVAVFEPNISAFKSGFIPFLICDTAERTDENLIEKVFLLNFGHMHEHRTFRFMLENTALHARGKIEIYRREFFAHFMARKANIVVSHQMDWAQNYLYFDAIHGDYPLLHNSPLFRDVGYFYPGSDIQAGAALLRTICRTHDDDLDAYRTRNRRAVDKASPSHGPNRDAYARRLIAVTSSRAGAA